MHRVHVGDPPLAQEPAVCIEHQDATVAPAAFTVGDVDIAVLPTLQEARNAAEADMLMQDLKADGSMKASCAHDRNASGSKADGLETVRPQRSLRRLFD